MTEQEKQEIINAVLAALRTNSKTINQLTSVSEMSEEDFLELNGGRKVSYGVLFANHMSNDDAQKAWEYLDANKVDKDSRGLVEVHQATVVYLDAMGNLDGHALSGRDGLEYRTDTKMIYDFPGGKLGAPNQGAVYISKNNLKKYVWNGTDMEELKADECPLFVDYMQPVSFADLPVGGSYYVPSSHKIAVKIDENSTKSYDPLTDALYFFREKGMIYTWDADASVWVPASSDTKPVNDLETGGGDKALSAEMGKRLKANVDAVQANIVKLYSKLANMAFWDEDDQAAAEPTPLDWSVPKVTVTITNNIGTGAVIKRNGVAVSGSLQVDMGDPLTLTIEAEQNYGLSNVAATVDGTAATLTESDGVYTLEVTHVNAAMAIVISGTATERKLNGYILDGLAFYLDGIDKGSVSDQWTDLIGGVAFPVVGNGVTSLDKGWQFNPQSDSAGGYLGVNQASGADLNFSPQECTIEVVYSDSRAIGQGGRVPIHFAKQDSNVLRCIYFNTTEGWVNGVYVDGSGTQNQDGSWTNGHVYSLAGTNANDTNPHTMSLSKVRAYCDCNKLASAGVNHWSGNGGGRYIGCVSSYNDGLNTPKFFGKCKLYSVRIYNRILTAEEVLANARNDIARFGLNITLNENIVS